MSRPARSPGTRPDPAPPTRRPPGGGRALLLAAGLIIGEGLAIVAVSIVYATRVHDEGHGVSAWGAAAVGVLVGLVVAAVVGRSLARGSQGAVAPTVLLQLICLGEAFNMAQESQWEYAVPVALIAAGALAATFVGVRKQTHRA